MKFYAVMLVQSCPANVFNLCVVLVQSFNLECFAISYLSANISNIALIEISFYLWLVYVYIEREL